MSSLAAFGARLRRVAAGEWRGVGGRSAAAIIDAKVRAVLEEHVRTGRALRETEVMAVDGGVELRFPDYVRFIPGAHFAREIPPDFLAGVGEAHIAAIRAILEGR